MLLEEAIQGHVSPLPGVTVPSLQSEGTTVAEYILLGREPMGAYKVIVCENRHTIIIAWQPVGGLIKEYHLNALGLALAGRFGSHHAVLKGLETLGYTNIFNLYDYRLMKVIARALNCSLDLVIKIRDLTLEGHDPLTVAGIINQTY